MNRDTFLREQLVTLLEGGEAHMNFSEAVADFPQNQINTEPPNVPYSFWHLVEHLRITQYDILDFCRNKNYKEINWPDDYWPEKNAVATPKDWKNSVLSFQKDLKDVVRLVQNPKTNLSAKIPWGSGQTYLREALLVSDHNAYHIGELAILRQVVGAWPKNR